MPALTTHDPIDPSELPASERVESFLECVELRRRRTLRVRLAAFAVGAVVATVVFLTSMGVRTSDAGRLVASAGTAVAGLLAHER